MAANIFTLNISGPTRGLASEAKTADLYFIKQFVARERKSTVETEHFAIDPVAHKSVQSYLAPVRIASSVILITPSAPHCACAPARPRITSVREAPHGQRRQESHRDWPRRADLRRDQTLHHTETTRPESPNRRASRVFATCANQGLLQVKWGMAPIEEVMACTNE
jgi:hypothetical protein